jgi:type IV pilus assembly protein PilM
MFLKKPKKGSTLSVGLDLGSSSIKLVALIREHGGKELKLWRYGVKSVLRSAGGPSNATTVKVIRELYAETKIELAKVISAIPGTSAVVRYIQMPRMSLPEARAALKYEAAQHIPFAAEEARMDLHILEGATTQTGGTMVVMLVATRKCELERRVAMLESAGLCPVILDVDSLAVLNAFETTGLLSEEKEAIGLVNIGARQTNFNVIHGGCAAFTRDVEVGGECITDAISQGLGISPADAENLKLSGDLIIQPHLEIGLRSVGRHLRSSLDYYQENSGNEIKKIYISGGTSLLSALVAFLTDSLGIPIEPWNPLRGIDISGFENDDGLRSLAPILTVAVGLASRSVGPQAQK